MKMAGRLSDRADDQGDRRYALELHVSELTFSIPLLFDLSSTTTASFLPASRAISVNHIEGVKMLVQAQKPEF